MCNSPASSETDANRAESEVAWTEEDVEAVKAALRAHGRNWNLVAEKVSGKNSEQCKKFYYKEQKKYRLDRIVQEYRKANSSGDQPPSLSTDEESGSSTSSCDEDEKTNNASNAANATSGANSNTTSSTNGKI